MLAATIGRDGSPSNHAHLGIVAVLGAGALASCVGDDPEPGSTPTPEAGSADTTTGSDAPVTDAAGSFPFEITVDRLLPRDGTPVQLAVTIGPLDKSATIQLVNPPMGISAQPKTILPSVTQDKLEVTANATAAPGVALLEFVASVEGLGVVKRIVRAVVVGPPGTIDNSFGDGGVVVAVTGFPRVAAFASGRILVAGSIDGHFGIVALRVEDGALDPTFGTNGQVKTTIGDASDIRAIFVQSDGKIVVAGSSLSGTIRSAAVARYSAAGVPDTTFDTDGFVVFDFGGTQDYASAVAVQADGKIVVAGDTAADDAGSTTHTWAIARRKVDGSPDDAFGGGTGVVLPGFGAVPFTGLFLPPIGAAQSIELVGPAPERIVVLGTDVGEAEDFRAFRMLPDGTRDPAFGAPDSGTVQVAISDGGVDRAVAILPGPAGSHYLGGWAQRTGFGNYSYGITRLNSTGSATDSFGRNRYTPNGAVYMYSMTLQSDGKLLVGGQNAGSAPEIARLLPDGGVDTTFGSDGGVSIKAGGSCVMAIVVQPDGRIVMVESSYGIARVFQ